MGPDDAAVQARTSVDRARTGSLTTYARLASRNRTGTVAVRPRADGTVVVRVGRHSMQAAQLLSRPVATLQVGPPACQPVLLHGAARRLPGVTESGLLAFHVDVAAVRVGAPAVLVDEQAYFAALPDPLRHEAPAVLAHLNERHPDALAACLWARGTAVGFVRAIGVDAGGLTLVAVGRDGVDTVRLRFPEPVSELSSLPASLGAVLSPRCRCCGSRPVHRPADSGRAPTAPRGAETD